MRYDVSLKNYNTFGIDVNANAFERFNSVVQLAQILSENKIYENRHMILGGGSNVLFTKPYDGLVLKNEIMGIEVVAQDADHVYVRAGAGENWHQFVLYCISANYAGVENLSLIPGCVGASPMQNIGAYGVEIKDVFHELEACHLKEKIIKKFNLNECAFGYRESVFKRALKGQFVISHVTFKLNKKPIFNTSYGAIEQELALMKVQHISIKAISDAVIRIRQSKLPDPKKLGNAGSFFKNPTIDTAQYQALKKENPLMPGYPAPGGLTTKVPAGWLIEQCGWKGFRQNDCGVHALQALVLVNYGNATGKQLYHLSTQIVDSVQQKFGIELEREVNIV